MTIEIEFEKLRDAIAYKFFMNNAHYCFEKASKNKQNIIEELRRLAKAGYAIAEIFLLVQEERNKIDELSISTDNDQPT
jgi:hypothetical protein